MDSPTTSKIPDKESHENVALEPIWKDIKVDKEILEPVAEKEKEKEEEEEDEEGAEEEEEEEEEDEEEEDEEEEEEEVIVISSDDEDRDFEDRFPSRAVLAERRRIFRAQEPWILYQGLKKPRNR